MGVLISLTADCDLRAYDSRQAANAALLTMADKLIAVWDGQPGKDRGGTGALVEQARQLGKPVRVIWPEGAARG